MRVCINIIIGLIITFYAGVVFSADTIKVSRVKSTSYITETQFGQDAEVLLKNAKNSHPGLEIEVVDMTIDEYNSAIKVQTENSMSQEQKDERKIKKEMDKVLRKQAIEALKAEGKLPADYKE